MTKAIAINESSLRDAVIEYMGEVDGRHNCHVHLRIGKEGKAYVDVDTGYTISEAEFNKTEGHAITVRHARANGACSLEDGWTDGDDALESISEMIENIVSDLEDMGYEVSAPRLILSAEWQERLSPEASRPNAQRSLPTSKTWMV